MEYNKVPITFIGKDGIEITTQVSRELKTYIENLEKDAFDAFALYDLISFSLYQDSYVWSTLPDGLFVDEILRNFYNKEGLEKLKQAKENNE